MLYNRGVNLMDISFVLIIIISLAMLGIVVIGIVAIVYNKKMNWDLHARRMSFSSKVRVLEDESKK